MWGTNFSTGKKLGFLANLAEFVIQHVQNVDEDCTATIQLENHEHGIGQSLAKLGE